MLALVANPVFRVLAVLLAFVGWTAYQRHDAAVVERARLTAEYKALTLAEVNRQTAAAQAVASAAQARADDALKALKSLQEIADAAKAELKASGNVCPVPDSLAAKLRSIH